ncbi:glycoside hydrolase family 3 C-terminal domain-containing protein [Aerococcaceae bacterium zg-BR9]|uniref:beta-glucosidase n=1 Tax=Aerococcaceae bacterium zg-1292 TaxID=2774330 RepID=UPI004064557E|nr:glycoside hydrolase family 3 C-terminal domain-containing protein [Aerococcaceae bacterium zg-BR9]MBF6626135.1 glycoside hydrolase family 3 C-terminal domain-containing protein [Aerococcaceae bacterium zg-BR9]
MKYQSIIEKMSVFEKAQLMTGKSTWETKDFEKYGIPSIFLSDGPHGIRKQLGDADHLGLNESIPSTCFPTAATVANSWNIHLAEQVGRALGKEAKELGVNVILGPGMNIKRNPLCGRNFEYFSEDPMLTAALAGAYVKGIQQEGVAACPKHFAANSQELRRMSNDSIVDERTLREIYLQAFETVVRQAKPDFMMTAYNQLNGEYTNEHQHLLEEILYKDWQYEGVIVTDWGGSNDHAAGVRAGSHLEMPGTAVSGAMELERAVKEGRLPEAILDKRVDELLDKVMKLYQTNVEKRTSLTPVTQEQHHQLAYQVAQDAIVLLKNERQILPIQSKQTVAFIGDFVTTPRYQGAGSSVVNPTRLETIEAVKANYGFADAQVVQGYHRSGVVDEALISEAVAVATQVEVPLVFVGLTEITESEGMDRTDMQLSEDQLRLIEAIAAVNPNTVVILSGGSAVELPFLTKVPAMVHGYLGGQAGARAMMDVLTGTINPSGKLAESYPLRYQDVPSANYYPGLEKTSEYREGIFVGYRYFDTADKDVAFPFGYGLSYTTFEYRDLHVQGNQASVTVMNTGDVTGSEIVQLYIGHESTRTFYAKHQLANFAKITLQPGESRQVTLTIPERSFQYFNVKTNQWEIDGGVYTIEVGPHSRNLPLVDTIEKEATTNVVPYVAETIPSYFNAQVAAVSSQEFEALLGFAIPESQWDKSADLTRNDTLSQMYYAKSPLARLAYRVLTYFLERSMKKGKPNLNLYFNYNMTFRAMGKMTGGLINSEMVNHILTIVNGHFFTGSHRLVKAYFANQKAIKQKTTVNQ